MLNLQDFERLEWSGSYEYGIHNSCVHRGLQDGSSAKFPRIVKKSFGGSQKPAPGQF